MSFDFGLWRFAKVMPMCSLLTLYCSGSWTVWFKCRGAFRSAAVTFTPWTVRLLYRFTFFCFPRNTPFLFFAPDQTFGNSLSDVNPLGMCNSPVQLMKKSAEEYSSPQFLGVTEFQFLGKKLLYVLQDLSNLSSSSKTFYRYIWSAITMSVSS